MSTAGVFHNGRRIRVCITSTAVVSLMIYGFLALNAIRTTSVTKSIKQECSCPPTTCKPIVLTQPEIRRIVPITTESTTTTPPAIKVGEFVQVAKDGSAVVLQDDFEPKNAQEGNVTEKKTQKKRNRIINVGVVGRPPNLQNQDGIITRFGFLYVRDIQDHSYLSQEEVLKLAEFFVYDDFKEIENSTEPMLSFQNRNEKRTNVSSEPEIVSRPLCPIVPPNLQGKVLLSFNDYAPPSLLDIRFSNPDVKRGGRYTPPCYPRSKIAIIVPFRGRESQFRVLLAHMLPIWQRQEIDFTIYTVTQKYDGTIFNKAKLMNIGFLEASKQDNYDCFVFHDVDMTLEDDRCLYRCVDSDNARELSVHLDKFEYQELKYHLRCRPKQYPEFVYAKYFGGVAMMTSKQLYDVNGYSNLFWGWGAEDMDMYLRLWRRGYGVEQPHGRKCSYHMIKHETEKSNRKNEGRFALIANTFNRMRYEGLTSIRYKILSIDYEPLFTNITVDVGRPKRRLVAYMNEEHETFRDQCEALLPWQ